MGQYSEGHYILGIEGLALLRAGAERDPERVEARAREAAELARRLEQGELGRPRGLPEQDAEAGYAAWAATYDSASNDTIAIEQAAMMDLLGDLPEGLVLDAACGTGRYTALLMQAGRQVVGVDSSPAMLAQARAKMPEGDFREGSLEALPLEGQSVSGVVCALALSHLPELGLAVSELARVLAPGGRLLVSNPHPLATAVLGWRASCVNDAGARTMIPEYPHLASDYVNAFSAAGLAVERCLEPTLTAEQARAQAKGGYEEAFAQALTGMPAVIVWEAVA